MRVRVLSTLLLGILFLACSSGQAWAGWIWSKETGWLNTNRAVRRSAKEIYQDAKTAYNEERWKDAYDDYRLLAVYLPESRYTEESMFHSADCLFHMGRYNAAARFYKDYLNYYPGTRRIDEVIDRMHNIGRALLKGKRYDSSIPFIGSVALFSNRQAGIDILTEIVDNYPYIRESDNVLATIADYYYNTKEYDKAVFEYEKILNLYLLSDQRDWAMFRIGESHHSMYRGPNYSHGPLPKAHEGYRQYLKQFPDGDYREIAEQRIDITVESLAEKEYTIAMYYRKVHEPYAAVKTLEALARKYPGTIYAEQAKLTAEDIQEAAEQQEAARQEKTHRRAERSAGEKEQELIEKENKKLRRIKKQMRLIEKEEKKRKR